MDEVKGLIGLAADWSALLLAVLVFSFAPHLVLHLALLLYPKGSERPAQILADLFDVPRWKKPFWVAEMALMAVFEAIPARRALRQANALSCGRYATWMMTHSVPVGAEVTSPLVTDVWRVVAVVPSRNRHGAHYNSVKVVWVRRVRRSER